MQIDPKRCVACGNCVAVCPMEAIYIDPVANRAQVNRDECVECYTCFRGMSRENLNPVLVRTVRRMLGVLRLRFDPEPDICPTSAIVPDDLEWPRTVRRAFSDVTAPHESTGIHGRGTEEVKTNDVTNRLDLGRIGCTVELGRPGIGVRFRDVETVTRALAQTEVAFEDRNPVTCLMSNRATGTLNPDILDEKVMSVIIEVSMPEASVPSVLKLLSTLADTIPTTLALGISTRCDADGHNGLEETLMTHGFETLRAKTNIGLGRPDMTLAGQEAAR